MDVLSRPATCFRPQTLLCISHGWPGQRDGPAAARHQKESTKVVIKYSRFELDNGLRILIQEDHSTPLVAVNVLYDVGARDESPHRTGFAHLFEHLMFGGSANIPDFDDPLQRAGGENNAFTNNDITSYYELLPARNLEIGLWLESDRMLSLNIDQETLDVQRKVVIEEFKETCLNLPYGDLWHHLSDLAYKVHPYRWPTIGQVPQHIQEATLDEVRDFYFRYYRPNNAILVIAGAVNTNRALKLVKKWFADIPAGRIQPRQLPAEPPQRLRQYARLQAAVPNHALYLAFHMPGRQDPDFYAYDLLSDILGHSSSARLYQRLVRERELFEQIDCYITGNLDPGLLVIEGKPAAGVSFEQAKAAIWDELMLLTIEPVDQRELQKVINKTESALLLSDTNIVNRAINLAVFELLGEPELINEEVDRYRAVTPADLQRIACTIFTDDNSSELYYEPLPATDTASVSAAVPN